MSETFISEKLELFRKEVKNNKPHIEIKNFKKQMLKKHRINKDYKRENILKKARKKAHNIIADSKRDLSNEIRNQ